MRSPMISLITKREERIAIIQCVIAAAILIGIFVGLGLMAIEALPDPTTLSVTQ